MKTARPLAFLVAFVPLASFASSCASTDDVDVELAEEAFAALEDPWGPDPCAGVTPNPPGKGVTITHVGGRALIVGTDDADDIQGTNGDDVVCTFRGRDVVHAGGGDDYVDGGSGNDEIWGDGGNDTIHGRGGGDEIHGGPGNDRLFGDILDDKIWGDEGNDLLVGAHGADLMHGGPGDDWIRGDTNTDSFVGGEGNDTASFVTAMPPGQPQEVAGMPNPTDGVVIDFAARTASGDGFEEPLEGIEKVVGSPFDDRFLHVGARTILDGHGNDLCDDAPCGSAGRIDASKPFVWVSGQSFDRGLLVMGSTGDDRFTITRDGHAAIVTSTTALAIGDGCVHVDANEKSVRCSFGDDPIRFVLGWGDTGNDVFEINGSWPRDVTVHVDGGEGDDTITGGDEEDVFFTGRMGRDVLTGKGGDDALISESRKSDLDLPGSAYPGGGDTLIAGDGDDQLVVDYPCGGHFYSGGPGIDVAGFARSGSRPLTAQLDGKLDGPDHRQAFVGRAFNDLCQGDWQTYGTTMEGNLEILEGTDGDDHLHGNDANNVIWGREGKDHLYGYGGDDVLEGLLDDDWIWGGAGRDVIDGGQGNDHLFGGDGQEDIRISCGDDGGIIESRDAKDPGAAGCRPVNGVKNVGGTKKNGNGGNGNGGSPGCSGDDFALPGQSETHCYRIITPRTWDQARQQCQDVGKHLATLSLEENQHLVQSGRVGDAIWIGGHRQGATRQFYWVVQDEGFPGGNAPWNQPGEANDPQGDKCVSFLVDGTWGLRSCDDTIHALCEDF